MLWQLADLYMRKGDAARAEAVINDALERKVDEHRLLLKLGESRIEAKRFDEAERAIKAALEKKPGLALARFDLGLVYEGQGADRQGDRLPTRRSSARTQGVSRRRSTPRSCCSRRGRSGDAIAHFRKVVEIEPTFGVGQLYLAKALLDAGDLEGAERWARSGLANKPEPRLAPLGHYVLADVYERQGKIEAARKEVEAAKRAPPRMVLGAHGERSGDVRRSFWRLTLIVLGASPVVRTNAVSRQNDDRQPTERTAKAARTSRSILPASPRDTGSPARCRGVRARRRPSARRASPAG